METHLVRVLVCGGRNYSDEERVNSVLDSLHKEHRFAELIEGGAKGADRLARLWAAKRGVKTTTVRANWLQYGRAAGIIRNTIMIEKHPDLVVAFPGGSGTADMMAKAKKHSIPLIEVKQ
jgi:predicted polyphosphate/ATP-dependent NAD kinase